jgi:hypothetical protein
MLEATYHLRGLVIGSVGESVRENRPAEAESAVVETTATYEQATKEGFGYLRPPLEKVGKGSKPMQKTWVFCTLPVRGRYTVSL